MKTPLFPVLALALGVAPSAHAVPTTIATINFDTDNAVTTGYISGGGYVTDFDTGLHSGSSLDWSAGNALGTLFQVPTFQYNYSSSAPVHGEPRSSVTLGQDADFPKMSGNERDIILLGWGAGNGLVNQAGNDLAVFEQATSEAFAVRVHDTANGWSQWYQQIYENVGLEPSALENDTTPTLFDLSDLGLGPGAIINALEITNLLAGDTVGTSLGGGLGFGSVYFGGSSTPGQNYTPARYSSSQAQYVAYEAGKFDPDIQYVVGLHDLVSGVSSDINIVIEANGHSAPQRHAPTDPDPSGTVPQPPVIFLIGLGMFLLHLYKRRQVV